MRNKVLRRTALIGISILILLVVLQLVARTTVENFLFKKLPSHIVLTYDELNVNLLLGRVQFDSIYIQLRNRKNKLVHSELKAGALNLTGLNYLQLFFNNTISLKELTLSSPRLEYRPDKRMSLSQGEPPGVVQLLRMIKIDSSRIVDGYFKISSDNDSTLFEARQLNFDLLSAETSAELMDEKIPIRYKDYNLSAEQLYLDLGSFEKMSVEKIVIEKDHGIFNDIRLISKYSKKQLSSKIKSERDHLTLKIPSLSIVDFDFGFSTKRFFFKARQGMVDQPFLEIYRDKLVNDHLKEKPMPGKVLRNLPFDLEIDSVHVVDGLLRYEEKTKFGAKPGKLIFDSVDISISNIGNMYEEGKKTSSLLTSKMMGVAPLELRYDFDMNDRDEVFRASGSLMDLKTEQVNTFLAPTVGATTTGAINELYFTIVGDEVRATGEMKMRYSNFKFKVQRNDRSVINKVLTTVGNWFIDDGNADEYRYGQIAVERDVNKSFFNYLWRNVEDGVLSTLTGDGEKK